MADGKKISELDETQAIEDAHYFAITDGSTTEKVSYAAIKDDLFDYTDEIAHLVSPTVTPSEITGGHRLTITDINGTSTVDVMDGTPIEGIISEENLDEDLASHQTRRMAMSGFSESSSNNLGIFRCVKSWLDNNDKLYYGNNGNPNSYVRTNGVNTLVSDVREDTEISGKFPLDCMSFVTMCLLGIGFEQSIFGDKTNKSYYPKATIPFMTDDFYLYCHHNSDGTWSTMRDNEDWHRVLTWQFAEYLNDRGLYHHVENNGNGCLRIGDIVFFKSDAAEYANRFEHITHVGIYLGIGRFGHHTVCDCTSTNATYPIRIRSYEGSDIIGYARIPVGMGIESAYSVAKPHNALMCSESHGNERAIMWLDRPIENWGAYLVKYSVTITNSSYLNVNEPAFKVYPADFTYCRYAATNGKAPTFELNVPKYIETTVYLSPEVKDLNDYTAQQYLSLSLYPNVESGFRVRVLEVIPIISTEPDASYDGVWVAPITATTLQDAVDALNTQLGVVATTYTSLHGHVRCTINGATAAYMFRFVRPSNANRLIAIFTAGLTGVSKQILGGVETYTTYNASNPVPFEWYMQ